MPHDQLAELEALARLAALIAAPTADDPTTGVHALASSMKIRLVTLAGRARLAQDDPSMEPPSSIYPQS